MANQAEVNVKNVFIDKTINVKRLLKDGTPDLDYTVAAGEAKKVQLPDTEVSLVVAAPGGMDLRDCLLKVKSDIDMEIRLSRTEGAWTGKIIPNDLDPETPLSVNYTVGQDEPD